MYTHRTLVYRHELDTFVLMVEMFYIPEKSNNSLY